MATPASAIAWELRQRHRWGLAATAATPLALGAIKLAVLTTHTRLDTRNTMTFALLVPVPLAATFLYLLAVFTFGISNAATVALYTLRDGGHTWPGGSELPEWLLGKTIRNFDATAESWRFFEQHPRTIREDTIEAAPPG
jgi:hypothetical protein